ncbi:hypothetical protein DNU06_02630 [Putridiphycobacter roseus]|uniref:Transcription elongation factor GreA/GreB C-terminal domain-containing protein n=1 Tax=Putridiphycobacter roseus TaxID=2219161 RepID=A0A2W1NI90_9FLAO|nr:GreA/GreB family elongation factor [Putridiphycobacter roseus]PZE18743.1 hypothetical protein DNU06_02630 [Putridiphycobacter roseus]
MAFEKVKLRKEQRNYLLDRVVLEKPVDKDKKKSILLLKEKLEKAALFEGTELTDNYVQLNSIVTIKTSFGFKYGLQIVLPEEADIQSNKLSVFSSVGSAIYGNKEGDTVGWFFLNALEYVEIIKVSKMSNHIPKSLLRP